MAFLDRGSKSKFFSDALSFVKLIHEADSRSETPGAEDESGSQRRSEGLTGVEAPAREMQHYLSRISNLKHLARVIHVTGTRCRASKTAIRGG